MLPADEVLTVDEVARYLRVHPMTVQRWCRTGDLPAAKIGRAYRIKKGDLDEWWAKHTARGEQPASGSSSPVGALDR
jgi:excisionase family DNA binding protein